MSDTQQQIGKLCPEAQFDTEGQYLLVTVQPLWDL